MGVPWVAVSIGRDAEALGPADPVLDRGPEAAEAAVVVLLIGGRFATLGLLVGDVEVRVFLVVALVGAVGVAARVGKGGPARRIVRSCGLPGCESDTLTMRPLPAAMYSVFRVWRFSFPE